MNLTALSVIVFPISFFFEACNRQCLGLPFLLPPEDIRVGQVVPSNSECYQCLGVGGGNDLLNEENEKSSKIQR